MAEAGLRRFKLRSFGFLLFSASAWAESRFPKPDFASGYDLPPTPAPPARASFLAYVDVAVLLLALSLASYLVLKKRSRRDIFLLMCFSLLYFGFYREGCVCPIGSIQNVAMALFDSGYAVPITVVIFFALPLFFSLLFGRVFCAAVCPLGAIQDLVVYKPVKVPAPLATALGMIPYIYLGTAVLFAAIGSAFLICRYDPFVAFFRLTGDIGMLAFGGSLLLVGMFIARPYCRFLCPYGVLLNWTSRFAWKHMAITPDTCINCRLCEEACPFDCIKLPNDEEEREPRSQGRRRLLGLLALLPVLVLLGGWIGSYFHIPLSQVDRDVALAEQVAREDAGEVPDSTLASDAFRETDTSTEELFADVRQRRSRFESAGWILGGFIGLVLGGTLIGLSIHRLRTDYEAERASCYSCGRCFMSCSREHLRLGLITEAECAATAKDAT
jgi:NosR/NirI family nitrous oxide reductase transcriptional regulator